MAFTANYKSNRNLFLCKSDQEMASKLMDQLLEIISGKTNRAEKISIALSGGRTPLILFRYLSVALKSFKAWDRILVFWGDERCVPPDNPESNYKNAYDTFLSKVPIPEENIYRMQGENDPEHEAKRYSSLLKKLNIQMGVPVFDLILLGMGDDGHTASIFPDQMHLLRSEKFVETAVNPYTKQKRLTLTGRLINNARNVSFLLSGDNKARIFSEIYHERAGADAFPAFHIRPQHGTLSWFCDEKAAGLL